MRYWENEIYLAHRSIRKSAHVTRRSYCLVFWCSGDIAVALDLRTSAALTKQTKTHLVKHTTHPPPPFRLLTLQSSVQSIHVSSFYQTTVYYPYIVGFLSATPFPSCALKTHTASPVENDHFMTYLLFLSFITMQ